MCVRKYLLQKCTTCYFGLSLNPPYVYLCGWLRSPASLHLFLQCSYILFPPFSGSSSFGRLNQTNPARLISFLLARAMTGPRWPSWEATYMCVCSWMCRYTWLQRLCALGQAVWAVVTWLCVMRIAAGIVCVSLWADSGILAFCLLSSLLWHVLWLSC